MATEVQIAKLALQSIGDRWDITSLSEATPEAEQVNLIFDEVRDQVLRAHPWKFAVKHTSPSALAGTVPANWDYMFTYPSDALKILNIVNPAGRTAEPIKFDIFLNAANVKVIVCDVEEPEFKYIKQVTDPSLFDASFVTAFAARLAQYLVMPLTGDRALWREMIKAANAAILSAQQESANEGVEDEHSRDPDWIAARA